MQRLCPDFVLDIRSEFAGESIEWNGCEISMYKYYDAIDKFQNEGVFNVIFFDPESSSGKAFRINESGLLNKSPVVDIFVKNNVLYMYHFSGFYSRWNLSLDGKFVDQYEMK